MTVMRHRALQVSAIHALKSSQGLLSIVVGAAGVILTFLETLLLQTLQLGFGTADAIIKGDAETNDLRQRSIVQFARS